MNRKDTNKSYISGLHPEFQSICINFLNLCESQGILLQIYSGTRTLLEQDALYKGYLAHRLPYPAARPGQSYHNYGLAIDVIVTNNKNPRDLDSLKRASLIAKSLGMEWGGSWTSTRFAGYKEIHHFQYTNGRTWRELKDQLVSGKYDSNGFVTITDNSKKDTNTPGPLPRVMETINSDIDNVILEKQQQNKPIANDTKQDTTPLEKKISKVPATGIWQIIKTIIDKEVSDKNINDTSISFNQGSLFTFVQKLCQKPFVEFFGDTYGDQYHFIIRKPPFTQESFNSLYTIDITDNVVNYDDLGWNNSEIYSWYQLIPQGAYSIFNNQIFEAIPAMFFEEYAQIWGSKPLCIVSNYVNTINELKFAKERALNELKFLIETHSYLPFTRRGTINIQLDRRIKRGMRIKYLPTGEYFYVDTVHHTYNKTEAGIDAHTTLMVSRGMEVQYCDPLGDKVNLFNYFNLIDFGDLDTNNNSDNVEKDLKINMDFYFEADSDNLIFENTVKLNKIDYFLNPNQKTKTAILDRDYPDFRSEKARQNDLKAKKIVKQLGDNRGMKIKLQAYSDIDSKFDKRLPRKRIESLKNYIVSLYKLSYKDNLNVEDRIELNSDIIGLTEGEVLTNANNRKATLKSIPFITKSKGDPLKNSKHWRVRIEVFRFFLQRRQKTNNTANLILPTKDFK